MIIIDNTKVNTSSVDIADIILPNNNRLPTFEL